MAWIIGIVALILYFDCGDLAFEGNRPSIPWDTRSLPGGWKFTDRSGNFSHLDWIISLWRLLLNCTLLESRSTSQAAQCLVQNRICSPLLRQSGEPVRITAPGGSDYRCPRSSCFWANEKEGILSLWFHVDRQLFSAWPVCLSQNKWQVVVFISFTKGVLDCWVSSFSLSGESREN